MTEAEAIFWGAAITAGVSLAIGYRSEILLLFRKKGGPFAGMWKGEAEDLEVPNHLSYDYPRNYNLSLELEQKGESVSGEIIIEDKEDKPIEGKCKIYSVNISDEYIAFKYALKKQHASHFGFALLELRKGGQELFGFYLTRKVFHEKKLALEP